MTAVGTDDKDIELACMEQRHIESQLINYYLFLFGVVAYLWTHLHGNPLANPKHPTPAERLALAAFLVILLSVFAHLWRLFSQTTIIAGNALAARPDRFPHSRGLYLRHDRGIGWRLGIIAFLPFGSLGYLGCRTLSTCQSKIIFVIFLWLIFVASIMRDIHSVHRSLTRREGSSPGAQDNSRPTPDSG